MMNIMPPDRSRSHSPKRVTSHVRNKDGSLSIVTTTTTTRWDGRVVTKTKKSRSKTPPPSSSKSRSQSPMPTKSRSRSPRRTTNRPRSISPPRTRSKTPPNSTFRDILGAGHCDNEAFEIAVKRCIPSEFVLIASQDDYTQAQEDYYAMDHYNLKPAIPRANAGSVATCALLQLFYENPQRVVATNARSGITPLNCWELSQEIQRRIYQCSKLQARPTISSSRPLGPPRLGKGTYAPFYIVPPKYTTGIKRALLIGVVSGEGPDLKGPPNDIFNVREFLIHHCGFKQENITVLLQSSSNAQSWPTRKNILNGFAQLVKTSKPHDVNFIQFSGHGGRLRNNLFILPSDCHDPKNGGPIMDEDILKHLIKAMPAQVYTTMLVDCCYSGTVGDLPYILNAKKSATGTLLSSSSPNQQIDPHFDTDTRSEMLHKEKEGTQAYHSYKKARAEQRTTVRGLAPYAKYLHDMAEYASETSMAAAAAAAQAARDVSQGLANTGTAAYDTATQASTAAVQSANAAAEAAAKSAQAASKAAYDSATQASTAAAKSAEAAATAAAEAAKALTGSLTLNVRLSNTSTTSTSPKRDSTDSVTSMYSAISQAANSMSQAATTAAETASSTLTQRFPAPRSKSPVRRTATSRSNSPKPTRSPVRRTVTVDSTTNNTSRSRSPLRRMVTPLFGSGGSGGGKDDLLEDDSDDDDSPTKTTTNKTDTTNRPTTRSPIRRVTTSPMRTATSRSKSPMRTTTSRSNSPMRTTTSRSNSPMRTTSRSKSPLHKASSADHATTSTTTTSAAQKAEEAARQEAIERSKREAAQARAALHK
jgi:hypothetical protein